MFLLTIVKIPKYGFGFTCWGYDPISMISCSLWAADGKPWHPWPFWRISKWHDCTRPSCFLGRWEDHGYHVTTRGTRNGTMETLRHGRNFPNFEFDHLLFEGKMLTFLFSVLKLQFQGNVHWNLVTPWNKLVSEAINDPLNIIDIDLLKAVGQKTSPKCWWKMVTYHGSQVKHSIVCATNPSWDCHSTKNIHTRGKRERDMNGPKISKASTSIFRVVFKPWTIWKIETKSDLPT